MRVTRSWLNEFIDLSKVSNETLYATFNAIGLEVDSIKQISIDDKVVIGKILSVEKHPDADKLNVCQIDVGSGTRQIVCGASNVVDAKYVAVATIGAVLPEDFKIKHAKLRGVESEGMVCASSELGLPEMGKGIMILDESIGELIVGKALNEYPLIADTLIELELTANRGDCLSIYGVARDLSTALELEMKTFSYQKPSKLRLGMAREAELHISGMMQGSACYKLAKIEEMNSPFLLQLRLAMVEVEAQGDLASLFAYATHTTGVILRAYNSQAFRNEENKICVQAKAVSEGIMEIQANDKVISVMGVYQDEENKASDESKELLFEATYIHPDTLVEAVANTKLNTDTLYYKTSRGSNPDLEFGLTFLSSLMEKSCDISCYEGSLNINVDQKTSNIIVDAKEVSDIVGMDIPIAQIVQILRKLGFGINSMGNHVIAVSVPSFRHDISHIQDIAEEIVRIVGINNIPAKPFVFAEKPRLNNTTEIYKAKKGFKNRAVGACFYENISYVFADKSLLAQYHFPLVEESLDVANPIAEELNTLRSTILINLLLAVKRNVSHSRKSIALFEMGAVFGSKREQSQVLSFVFSGEIEGANISNSGKPKDIDFARFTQKIGAVVGAFELEPCTASNTLLHPYQSANVLIDGKVCGFISKLHPTAQEAFAVPETFIAELEMDAFLPKHQNATAISKFQGVYKDLSIVIDKSRSFYEVAKVLSALELEMLKESYAVDIYEDEKLGDKKSLTMRFFIQAMDKTLEEADIDNVMAKIMSALELECNASLR